MEKSVLIEIISVMCTSAVWGQYPLSHPESFRCTIWGMTASVANCEMAGILFLSWVPSGSLSRQLLCDSLRAASIICWYGRELFFFFLNKSKDGLPRRLSGKEPACQGRRCEFSPWAGKILWRRKWPPTIILLPGKSHGQRGLVDYSPSCCKRDTTQWLNISNNNKSKARDLSGRGSVFIS